MAMVYDLPTVSEQAQPLQPLQDVTSKNYAGEQLTQQGTAMTKAGVAMTAIAQDFQNEMDTAITKDMDNQLADVIRTTLYDPEKGYLKTSQKTALESRPDAVKRIQESVKKIESKLTTDAQRFMFKKVATTRMQNAFLTIDGHAMNQAKVYAGAVSQARMKGFSQDAIQAAVEGNTYKYNIMRENMFSEWDAIADIAGIPKSEDKTSIYQQGKLATTTQLHSDVINVLISQGRTTAAKDHFAAAKKDGEIMADKLDELGSKVKIATTATEADDMATTVWDKFGPKDRNAPVSIFAMEQEVRKMAGSNEDVQKAAIAGIRERASGFNAEQAEYKAGNIAGVWSQLDSGKSFKQIQLSQEWLNLSGTERHQIKKDIEAEATMRENRAAARSAKELSELQRTEHLNFLKNGDEYLTITDPQVLRGMSRAQVEAQRGKFGMSATQHLLSMWDSIQNPAKFGEAKMDADDFYEVAVSLGLDPANKKDKNMRNQVGALRFHVEQVIDYEQTKVKRPLTRQEKLDLTRTELSRKVLVNPGVFSFNKSVPVIALTKDQAEKVVVPADARAKISEAMGIQYKKTNNPMYAPTEANLKQWYLKSISPGGSATFQDFQGANE